MCLSLYFVELYFPYHTSNISHSHIWRTLSQGRVRALLVSNSPCPLDRDRSPRITATHPAMQSRHHWVHQELYLDNLSVAGNGVLEPLVDVEEALEDSVIIPLVNHQ